MKIQHKILSLLFLVLFISCDEETTLVQTSPTGLMLTDPGIGTLVINQQNIDNQAVNITWSDYTGASGSYDVEIALDDLFQNSSNIGTSNTNNFTVSQGDLNTALNNLGSDAFATNLVYLRVSSSETKSNAISFVVIPIQDTPILQYPMSGETFTLDITNAGNAAFDVSWLFLNDNNLTITYELEAGLAGSNFSPMESLGTIENEHSLSVLTSTLNSAAQMLGIAADTSGDLDLRVKASYTDIEGNMIEEYSNTITFTVGTYVATFPYLYMVGDATTPGWSNDNNNTPIFRDQDVPNGYFFTGYFGAGAFKLLEVKGQWQPQWGTNDGSTLAVNPGGGSDPGTFNVGAAGYYTYTFTTVGEGGSFTVTPYDASGAPTYGTIGIIGDATPGGWGSDTDFTQDPNNPHLWYLNGVTLNNGGQMLIRANDDWADVWRYTGSSELYGTSVLAGGGDNIPFNAPTGTYDVWFNDLDGAYVIIPN